MKRTIMTATACLIGLATVGHAQDGVPASVKARQGLMQNYAFALGTLGGMARGNVEYDAELAQRTADRLVALASIDKTDYWRDGTSSDDVMESRALPAIWENMDDFMSGFDDLRDASESLAAVAGDGPEAIGGQMRGIGGSCGGCHEDYQLSND